MSKNKDIYQEITNKIIDLLEKHQLSFTKTWFNNSAETLASNPISKTVYLGINQLVLSFTADEKGYTQNRWMTFRQGKSVGANVRKGEISEPVVFYTRQFYDKKTGQNVTKQALEILNAGKELPENIKVRSILKDYRVFNIEQFDNVPEELFCRAEKIEYKEPEKDEMAEEILQKSGAKILFDQGSRCFYLPLKDEIHLVPRDQFKSKEGF